MSYRRFLVTSFLAVLLLGVVQAAPAQTGQHIYTVDFVCGYQPSNDGIEGYEPLVKVANYATKVDVFNYGNTDGNLILEIHDTTALRWAAGAVPQAFPPTLLPAGQTTLFDCATIIQVLAGGIPPFGSKPFVNGLATVKSDVPLIVWATKTTEVCASLVTWSDFAVLDPIVRIGPDGIPLPGYSGVANPPLVPSLLGCRSVSLLPGPPPWGYGGAYLGPAGEVPPGTRTPGVIADDKQNIIVTGVSVSHSIDFERVEGVFVEMP